MKRAIGGLILAVALAGCGNAPPPDEKGFKLSVEQAYQRLVNSNMAEMRDAFQCGLLVHLHPRGITNQSVTWSVSSSNREMFNFTVHLAASDDGGVTTRIAVSADERGGEAYDGDNLYPQPAMNQPIRPAIEEQVAALLEGRPFDRQRVQADWNEACLMRRTVLQNGRKSTLRDIPVAGQPRPRDSNSSSWGGRSGGWGR
jgi:hypothetical protein